jgi:hypothetical protein
MHPNSNILTHDLRRYFMSLEFQFRKPCAANRKTRRHSKQALVQLVVVQSPAARKSYDLNFDHRIVRSRPTLQSHTRGSTGKQQGSFTHLMFTVIPVPSRSVSHYCLSPQPLVRSTASRWSPSHSGRRGTARNRSGGVHHLPQFARKYARQEPTAAAAGTNSRRTGTNSTE